MTPRKPESELGYIRKSPLPTHLEPEAIEQRPTRLLPTATIQQIARETGFVVRERKVDPVAFFWTLVLGFGVQLNRFLEKMRAASVRATELEELAYSS